MINELEIVSYRVAFDLFMQVKGLKRCTGIPILHTFMNPREIKDAQFIAGEVEAWSGSEEGHASSVE